MILFALLLVIAPPASAQTIPLRPTIQAERIELKTTILQARQEFKTRVSQLRDARKKALVERINTRRCEVIQNRTAAMTRHLQTMTDILARVEQKAKEVDTSSAKTAIASARSAVDTLAATDCLLNITGRENQLRSEVAQSLQDLRAQFKSVHDQVQAARLATAQAVQSLAKTLPPE
ncbi:hypothetical protein HYS82_01460 [Candidatus Amesbacteria bacterium]|nr:hypothetical protein [Candidatus Amesbacteria bacterium]